MPNSRFVEWKRRLPNKRTLKAHDRVCERHFEDDMIVKFWETNINGVKHLTPRDKPKLIENAIPIRNMTHKGESLEQSDDDLLKKPKPKIEILSQKIFVSLKRDAKEKIEFKSPKKLKTVLDDAEAISELTPEEEKKSEKSPIKENTQEQDAEKLAQFEILYDEAFDVTLPSLLWGIHRDPDRKFLAFSEFDNSSMTTVKLLHISDSFTCKTFVNRKLMTTKTLLSNMTTDGISDLLDELDKVPLSSVDHKNAKCNLEI